MNFEDAITIDAGRARVWAVYSEVERWPEWTDSVASVERVSGSGVEVGATVRIRQPRLPAAVWEVTELDPGVSWTWTSHAPGITTVAWHRLAEQVDGTVRVELGIEQRGALGRVVGTVYSNLIRRYLAMEAAGLKARCESSVPHG
jgi:Polyketide cyclase / dehydrase and lipid transport